MTAREIKLEIGDYKALIADHEAEIDRLNEAIRDAQRRCPHKRVEWVYGSCERFAHVTRCKTCGGILEELVQP